jgi:hypothetical protein
MPTLVVINLNARLQPIHRGEIYEDPLQELLDARAPGSVISGGGTLMSPEGEPTASDIDVELEGDPEAGLELIIEALHTYGAPKGSKVTVGEGESVSFGATEGIGLYLNGTDLPDDVYADNDVNELIERLVERLGSEGSMQSWWHGPRETALYLYGGSAQRMGDLIGDVLAVHPLAQQSRLVPLT